jgi:hypothetical protein
MNQPVCLERLFDVIVRPALDGRNRCFNVAVTGDDHDRHFRIRFTEDIEQGQSVEAASHQPDIQNDKRRLALLHCSQGAV